MVKVVYEFDDESLREEVVEPNILLTNKKGGYFLDFKTTKYRGLFTTCKTNDGWSLIKSIDTISISEVSTEFIKKLWGFEKKHQSGATEQFFLHNDTLLYEVNNYEGTSLLTLDTRDIYNFDAFGKKYSVSKEKEFIIIKFSKGDFVRYIAIKTNVPYTSQDKWVENFFEFDSKRNNAPISWYVYESLLFKIIGSAKIAISSSDDREKAMSEANFVYYSSDLLKSQKETELRNILSRNAPRRHIDIAYKCSLVALDSLFVSLDGMKGLYAGLPWFFQVWTRDEAISLGAYIREKKFEFAKEIILRETSNILPDGRLVNKIPLSGLGSADGVGWSFKRFSDMFYESQKEKKPENVFPKADVAKLNERLKDAIEKMSESYIKQKLTLNRKKETWMDTDVGNDPRDGARIEIQALTLNMIKTAKDVCRYLNDIDLKKYETLEKEMKDEVKKVFYKNGVLYDGFNDPTIRPNIFLAYYIYPELLTNAEWEGVFKKSLEALWLDWGGVSTIDKKNYLFCEEYTGMNDKSYHRGDSWYFLNNLTAICLYRLNNEMFKKYITKIVHASTEEILRMGVLGCHSEVSSAKEQRSEGTISQAWSSAMYIEMVNELFLR